MLTFVLVPGAFHGAWCFDRVIPHLSAAGFGVVAVDLPGTGAGAGVSRPPTQASWTGHVVDVLSQLDRPAILVGHSRGGIVNSLVAERAPHRIALNVYLAAALLPDGTVPIHGMLAASGSTAGSDERSLPDQLPVPPFEVTRQSIFNMCTEADARIAYSRLSSEPIGPMRESMTLTHAGFGQVPRAYIECLQDRAVPLEQQRAMQALLPCATTVAIDTDHSPFLSAPALLVGALITLAKGGFIRP